MSATEIDLGLAQQEYTAGIYITGFALDNNVLYIYLSDGSYRWVQVNAPAS